MKKLILASLIAPLMLIASCGSAVPGPDQKTSADPSEEPSKEPEKQAPEIVLTAPENDVEITLTRGGETEFRWDKISGQAFYNILFSAYKTMVNATQVEVRANHITFSGSELGDIAEGLGIAKGETKDLYWSVIPWAEGVKYTPQVRCIKLTNFPPEGVHPPVAEPIKVKVAVVIEDPVFTNPANASDPRNGKRIHEIEHWNDPWKQYPEYAADFEEYSAGVVDIEIVEVIDSPKMFCYTRSTQYDSKREYMTPDILYKRYFDPTSDKAHIDIDGKDLEYDYVAMLDETGLTQKVEDGTVNEVWVYNHPACHMNESRFMGEGGFWCNSGPIGYGTGRDEAHNRKLVCVMFCNYERTVDLALHSFAHRTESIMSQLNYNNFWGFPGSTYNKWGVFTYVYDHVSDGQFSGKEEDLIPFDKFFSHGKAYEAVGSPGYAHIGTCHCPCNTDKDYIYWDKAEIYTFADEWLNYPYIYSDKSKARKVSCEEWKHPSGEWQYGYMKWFYSHVPHFQGSNTFDERDLHLNNWWHYLFDYYGALEKEAQLREEYEKNGK